MPFNFVFGDEGRKLRHFGGGFLHAVFAQHADARFDGLSNQPWFDGFADGDQCHVKKIAACALARSRDSLLDFCKSFVQLLSRLFLLACFFFYVTLAMLNHDQFGVNLIAQVDLDLNLSALAFLPSIGGDVTQAVLIANQSGN